MLMTNGYYNWFVAAPQYAGRLCKLPAPTVPVRENTANV